MVLPRVTWAGPEIQQRALAMTPSARGRKADYIPPATTVAFWTVGISSIWAELMNR